jgi:hypothetical protein
MTIVKILDIQFDLDLIHIPTVAKRAGISHTYTRELLDPHNKKKNALSLRKLRDAIIDLYGNLVKYNSKKKVRAAA